MVVRGKGCPTGFLLERGDFVMIAIAKKIMCYCASLISEFICIFFKSVGGGGNKG